MVACFRAYFGDCVESVTDACALELTRVDGKPRIPFDGKVCHGEAILRRGFWLIAVRRDGGWNEVYAFERERVGNLFGKTQVRKMNRIECASEETNAEHRAQCQSRTCENMSRCVAPHAGRACTRRDKRFMCRLPPLTEVLCECR